MKQPNEQNILYYYVENACKWRVDWLFQCIRLQISQPRFLNVENPQLCTDHFKEQETKKAT
ncbi:hypothetical protein BLOT_011013 [Blomia tropicalis]|nr:hypothetical protein BLOT_011013 [Blomia tropicalis]